MEITPAIREEHIEVARTARYAVLGVGGARTRQIWFVLHGYGQLARRFLRSFAPLDDGTRLVVAPEGLSRFYVDPNHARGGATTKVGASWMTRDDREREIEDYIRYLDCLAESVVSQVGAPARVVVLGFSQGVATACRWVVRERVRANRVVLWAGGFPPDLDLTRCKETFTRCTLTLVVGDRDSYVPLAAREQEEARLRAAGIPFTLETFDGGHELNGELVERLARTT